MKNIVTKSLQALLLVPVLALGVSALAPVATTYAACEDGSLSITNGAGCSKGDEQSSDLFGDAGVFRTITNVLLFIIGAVSVIMLIIGGLRYTISGGESGAVSGAKNTILYAVVGIIVAILAYAIVNFVLGSFIQ